MPNYTFKCPDCQRTEVLSMDISTFLGKKFDCNCPACQNIIMRQQFGKVSSKIERKKKEILPMLKEEARKIVKKVEAGDERMISKIYGDKPTGT